MFGCCVADDIEGCCVPQHIQYGDLKVSKIQKWSFQGFRVIAPVVARRQSQSTSSCYQAVLLSICCNAAHNRVETSNPSLWMGQLPLMYLHLLETPFKFRQHSRLACRLLPPPESHTSCSWLHWPVLKLASFAAAETCHIYNLSARV